MTNALIIFAESIGILILAVMFAKLRNKTKGSPNLLISAVIAIAWLNIGALLYWFNYIYNIMPGWRNLSFWTCVMLYFACFWNTAGWTYLFMKKLWEKYLK